MFLLNWKVNRDNKICNLFDNSMIDTPEYMSVLSFPYSRIGLHRLQV